MIAALSGPFYQKPDEAELEEKVAELLATEGLEGIRVEANNLHLKLSGEVADVGTLERAVALAERTWRAYVVDTSGLEVARPASAAFVVREQGGGVLLSGVLPNKSLHSKLAEAAAALPGMPLVENRTKIDPQVADPEWAADLPALMAVLLPAADGASLAARGGRLTIAGEVEEADDKAKILAAARASGLEVIDRVRLAEWEQPSAVFERRGDVVAVTGLFPDEASRQAALDTARAVAGGAEVMNKTRVGRHVRPLWWGEHQAVFVSAFFAASVADATLAYSPDAVKADGSAFESEVEKQLEEIATATPSAGRPVEIKIATQARPSPPEPEPVADVAVAKAEPEPKAKPKPVRKPPPPPPPPPPAPTTVEGKLKALAIRFKAGSAYLSTKEFPKIEQAVELLNAPESASKRLVIGGYAEPQHTSPRNRDLCLERAGEVRRKLIQLGIPADRMTLQFLTEDHAGNDPSDSWKTRRVEISLVKSEPKLADGEPTLLERE